MEYAIYPMKTINISQRANNNYSHNNLQAWDIVGPSTTEPFYAPCRVKVLAINPIAGLSNTVFFGSCDGNGNATKVMCEDGVARILTFVCTHMDDVGFNKYGIVEGKIFQSGEICYQAGVKGQVDGAHVHLEVAEGWVKTKIKRLSDGKYETQNITTIANIFYQLKEWNTISYANSYTFKMVSARTTEDNTGSYNGYCIYVNNYQLAVRVAPKSSTAALTIANIGDRLKIKHFLNGFQDDGYQWAATEFNGYQGYSQLDTKGYYTILQCENVTHPVPLYLIASSKGGYIRSGTFSNASIITYVPANQAMKIIELIPGFQSDGYQWARAEYNGLSGFVQIDLKNWHYFKN